MHSIPALANEPYKETAMRMAHRVARIGLDSHRTFGKVAGRGTDGRVAWRARLDYH